jgi:hypothetical protein
MYFNFNAVVLLYALSLAIHMPTVLFFYHKKYKYHIRCQTLKPITCVKPSPGFSGNVIQEINLE